MQTKFNMHIYYCEDLFLKHKFTYNKHNKTIYSSGIKFLIYDNDGNYMIIIIIIIFIIIIIIIIIYKYNKII